MAKFPTAAAAAFTGEYDDQLHPMCERKVRVDTIQLTGKGNKKATRMVATISG